jgi:hypothetical protein
MNSVKKKELSLEDRYGLLIDKLIALKEDPIRVSLPMHLELMEIGQEIFYQQELEVNSTRRTN